MEKQLQRLNAEQRAAVSYPTDNGVKKTDCRRKHIITGIGDYFTGCQSGKFRL